MSDAGPMKRVLVLGLLAAFGVLVAAAVAQSSTWPRMGATTTKTLTGRTRTVTQTTTAPTQTTTAPTQTTTAPTQTTTAPTQTTTAPTQTVTVTTVAAQPVNRTGPVEKGTAFQWGLTQSDPQYAQQLLS